MARFRSMCGASFLFLALAASSGCGDDDTAAVPTGPTAVQTATFTPSVTAEPGVVAPEFLPDTFCFGARPFSVRLALVIAARTRGALALRSVDFRFTDRLGFQSIPTASPIPFPQPGQSSGTVPIPPPGSAGFVPIPPGTVGRFPFVLRFGCGVLPGGLIRVAVGTMVDGRPATSQLTVRVAD